MQGSNRLLADGFDGNWTDRFVAQRFEETLRVRTVVLVAGNIRSDGMGRKQQDAVARSLGLSTPKVCRGAGLHDDGGRLAPTQEAGELSGRETMPFGDPANLLGYRDFQNRFRNIDGNSGRLHRGLLPCRWFAPLTTLAQRCRTSRGRSPFHHLQATVGVGSAAEGSCGVRPPRLNRERSAD